MSDSGLEYRTLYRSESIGSHAFGIHILIASSAPVDLREDAIYIAAYEAAEKVQQEVQAAVLANDQEAQSRAARERAELLALFNDRRIFVEPIANGYCSRACCRHLPWFVVTTDIGRFKIGWRKRVIHIEWTETIVQASAEALFPAENVTKDGRLIHAWSLDDARRYVGVVLEAARSA